MNTQPTISKQPTMSTQPTMSKHPTMNRFFRQVAPIWLAALSGLAGCGDGQLDPTDSLASALTGNSAGPYGSTLGTAESSGSNHLTPVTKIIGYASTAFVYGIKLFWGDGTSRMYGVTNNVRVPLEFDLTDDPINKVEYVVTSGQLRGIRFTNSTSSLAMGLYVSSTAFSNPDAIFTDLETWKGPVNSGLTVTWGAKFHYTTP